MKGGPGIRLEERDGVFVVLGYRCPRGCVATATYLDRCPHCAEAAVDAVFAGSGSIWARTTVRIASGAFPADRGIAYVDLADGPRVICEVDADVPTGSAVRIAARGAQGAPVAVTA